MRRALTTLALGALLVGAVSLPSQAADSTQDDFAGLVAAVGDSCEGDTVTLGGDINGVGQGAVSIGCSVTLNLNGHALTLDSIAVGVGFTLTIDETGGGSLTVDATDVGRPGIHVPSDATLIIRGGTITATGGDYCAGIGGARDGHLGRVYVDAGIGTVTATGGTGGAGIGGGLNGYGGSLEIYSGDVTAVGGTGASTVGGGQGTYAFGVLYVNGWLRIPSGELVVHDSGLDEVVVARSGKIVGAEHDPVNVGARIVGDGQIVNNGAIRLAEELVEVTVESDNYLVKFVNPDGVNPDDVRVFARNFHYGSRELPPLPKGTIWNTKADGSGETITDTTLISSDLTLYRVVSPAPEPEPIIVKPVPLPISFSDVSWFEGSRSYTPFHKEIQWLADKGISRGWKLNDGRYEFRPKDAISREAMAAFLYRHAGSPKVNLPSHSPFTDVPKDSQFYKEIVWLSQQGISTGWDAGSGKREYRPKEPIARDAMAAFLYRYAGKPSFTPPSRSLFLDTATSGTQFYKEITWLSKAGISTGWTVSGGKEFRPYTSITREAMAAFLYRYDKRYGS